MSPPAQPFRSRAPYRLDEIVEAHTLMEHGSAGGKLVVP
jgi:23S rRNA U2552 (ribose-2'-O)-methylase RlmE/FtsJ